MIAYFDASALVKHYVREAGSDLVEGWLTAQMPATSRWTHVEILSAVARRCREGHLTPEQRELIEQGLGEDFTGYLIVELTPEVISVTHRLFARHALRAGDCVQLASAVVLKNRTGEAVTFHGFDQRLNAVAILEGFGAESP